MKVLVRPAATQPTLECLMASQDASQGQLLGGAILPWLGLMPKNAAPNPGCGSSELPSQGITSGSLDYPGLVERVVL